MCRPSPNNYLWAQSHRDQLCGGMPASPRKALEQSGDVPEFSQAHHYVSRGREVGNEVCGQGPRPSASVHSRAQLSAVWKGRNSWLR